MTKKIIYEGELDLNGYQIPCFVLEDGTRILSGRGLQEALRIRDRPLDGGKRGGYILPTFFESKLFKDLIGKGLDMAKLEPIICKRGNQTIHGYEATILADICDLILQARKSGYPLTERQKTVADQCELLIRAFAKVGIIALVDEATGYQYTREKDDLQKILRAYIAPELLPWQKKFPDIFYKELFRLNGWEFTSRGIKKRPGVIGTWTKKLVYEQLPEGVLDELKKKTPKSEKGNYIARFHQNLTPDIGNEHLAAQLNQVITLFQLSDSMEHMWNQFTKLKARQSGQLELFFEFDEKGHTIDLPENNPSLQLSSFNKDLKKAINFNPKDKKSD